MAKASRRRLQRGLDRIQRQLGAIGPCLPGSIVVRAMRCGRPRCGCRADPPALHGPYIQWTRAVRGKTVTRMLTQEQLETYGPWFENAKRLHALVRELESLSLEAMAAAEGWAKVTPGTDAPSRSRLVRVPSPRDGAGTARP